MFGQVNSSFQERVVQAAEAVLERCGSVGPLELLQEMRWLQPVHFEGWRKGIDAYRVLEQWIQIGPATFERAVRCFNEWAQRRGLRAVEADYSRRTPRGLEALRVTGDGDHTREKFYRTHYAPADLSEKKAARLGEKLKKAPDLVVFQKVSEEGKCCDCAAELRRGDFLFMDKGQPLCLRCADLDHLVFLPAGDTGLSRRARKHSPLSAVVVRFSSARKRYERQGLLVTEAGLALAQKECEADAPERAVARAQAAVRREAEDCELVAAMTQAILAEFPSCPRDEASRIAEHTALRGSGRVGRSAAGRNLDPQALTFAVVAHIRHEHTGYDSLLMRGTNRAEARALVRGRVDSLLEQWRTPAREQT